jgi:predicted GH43/DUF377 family glycosyl hydrolase
MTVTAVPVHDTGVHLTPDPTRVIVRFFVPGNEDVGPGDSRALPVIDRVLALDDHDAAAAMLEVDQRFADRHPDLDATFEHHASLATQQIAAPPSISSTRRRLLGAAFTHEYAIEGAALCNPSIVVHPEQPDNGDLAFVLSVRCIGEGHRSSIGFRTGTITPAGDVGIDVAGTVLHTAEATPGEHHRGVLHRKLADVHDDHENAAYALDPLPERFDDAQLRARIAALGADAATRRHTSVTVANLERLAHGSYRTAFAAGSDLSQRVLWPHAPSESHGMEDARFVEITDGSAPRYCATYTAFDGTNINQKLITTTDFTTFAISPMAGLAARGKGLALFPRRIDGMYVALSRADRETNSIAFSDDLCCWDTSHTIQTPRHAWEVLQLGNCGSPIETAAGWIVLTHGVGPMRTYAIGAILLDLDDPRHVLATTAQPILTPGDEHGGYVPNVVYSCGALAVGDRLVIPYGIGDQRIAIASVSIDELIGTMRRTTAPAAH